MIWREVPGFENYEISISTKEGLCRHKQRGTIQSNKTYRGRIYWRLCNNGVSLTHQAAKWIAITYPEMIENEYFEGAQIDHKDTDRLNNHPSNLRWVTNKENSNNPITLNRTRKVRMENAKYPELIGLAKKDHKEYCRRWREISGYNRKWNK